MAKKTTNKVDKVRAIELKSAGEITYDEIAKIQGVTPQAIHKAIKDLLPNDNTQLYKQHKADILDNTALRMLIAVDDDKIKDASLNNIAYAFGQINNAARLERGESTQNVAYDARIISANIAELRQMLNDNNVIDANP